MVSQHTVWATQGDIFLGGITGCSLHQTSLLKWEARNSQSSVILPLSSSGFFFCLFIHLLMYSFIQQILINCLPFYILCLFPRRIRGRLWNQIWCKAGYPGIQTERRKRLCHQLQRWLKFSPVRHRKRIVGCLEFSSLPNQHIPTLWRK